MLQLLINSWQAHPKPFFGVDCNAIFWSKKFISSNPVREREFDFQSLSNNKKLKIPNTFLKKYRDAGTSVPFSEKYRRYR